MRVSNSYYQKIQENFKGFFSSMDNKKNVSFCHIQLIFIELNKQAIPQKNQVR